MEDFRSSCAGKLLIEALCAFAICGVSLLSSIMASKFINLAIFHQSRAPAVSVSAKDNALKSRSAIGLAFSIGHVLFTSGLAKIRPFVIGFVSIRMVDKFFGPRTSHECPNYAASTQTNLPLRSLYDNMKVAIACFGACRHANRDPIAAAYLPTENPFIGIVEEESSDLRNCRQVFNRCLGEFRHGMGLLAGWFSRLVKRPSGGCTLGGFATIAQMAV